MGKTHNPDDVATKRIEILGPLLYGEVDPGKHTLLLKQISEREHISERTLRRWLFSYQHEGYQGLLPKSKPGNSNSSVTESIVDEAVMLRREVPTRSIRQIITILEMEGLVEPGQIKRSTLQDHLMKRGYNSRQLRMYHSTGAGAARRFQRTHRNDLWQMDLKYLLVLPENSQRKAQQIYASVIIDDATRVAVACKVYAQQDTHNVLASFRHAIERYGIPDRIFTDHGSQYVSKHILQVCAKIGIKKLTAKPRAPSAKGKVEVINKYLDTFVAEVKLKSPQNAAEVQHYLDIWLQELYHNKPHSALEGQTPLTVFKQDNKNLRWASKEQLDYAFVFTEKRLVDKTGCLSFKSILWEAGQDLIGMKVDVAFRPDNPDEIEVFHEGFEPRKIKPLVITAYSAPRKRIPLPDKVKPETSRELDAAAKQYKKHRDLAQTAISYKDVWEDL
ncbi:MAG: transposase [Ruminococcaceae bacterium]|jgi:transposase InsO family protein|nr:transposase [Oscillospiraceae bacterium]